MAAILCQWLTSKLPLCTTSTPETKAIPAEMETSMRSTAYVKLARDTNTHNLSLKI